jgi:hypothetical protein
VIKAAIKLSLIQNKMFWKDEFFRQTKLMCFNFVDLTIDHVETLKHLLCYNDNLKQTFSFYVHYYNQKFFNGLETYWSCKNFSGWYSLDFKILINRYHNMLLKCCFQAKQNSALEFAKENETKLVFDFSTICFIILEYHDKTRQNSKFLPKNEILQIKCAKIS